MKVVVHETVIPSNNRRSSSCDDTTSRIRVFMDSIRTSSQNHHLRRGFYFGCHGRRCCSCEKSGPKFIRKVNPLVHFHFLQVTIGNKTIWEVENCAAIVMCNIYEISFLLLECGVFGIVKKKIYRKSLPVTTIHKARHGNAFWHGVD